MITMDDSSIRDALQFLSEVEEHGKSLKTGAREDLKKTEVSFVTELESEARQLKCLFCKTNTRS